MKITIYELAGLIKDCKAPKNIKYDGQTWELDYPTGDYFMNGDLRIWLFQEYTHQRSLSGFLNDEVEIIEEPKKIEKIEMYQDEEGHYFLNKQYRKVYVNCDEIDFMVEKFNELIDEINNLKEND